MKKIFKSIVSAAVSAALLLGTLPSMAAKEESELLYSQSFNSVITNTVPYDMVVVGKGARVMDHGEGEKALAFSLTASTQMAEVSAALSGRFFVSFDISADKMLTGGGLKLKNASNASFYLLKIADGKLCTHNGRAVCGINSKVTKITVEVDADKSSYSVYVNGQCKKQDYYVGNMSVREPVKVDIEVASSYQATAWIDNVNVGMGTAPATFPVDSYDGTSVPYEEVKMEVVEDVFSNTDFTAGKRLSGVCQMKDNILEITEDENGEGICLFKRKGTQDFHLDMNTQGYPSDALVYQFDLKLKSASHHFKSTIKSQIAEYFNMFSIANCVLTAGNARINLPMDQWQTLAVVYRVSDMTYDVYLNYECIAKDLEVNYMYKHDEAMTWRIHVNSTSGDDYFYVDNMVVYGGTKPRAELEIEEVTGLTFDPKKNGYPSDDSEILMLTGKAAYHTRSGVLFADGVKTVYNPVNKDGVAMVPAEFFAKAFRSSVSYDAATSKATVDSMTFTAGSKNFTGGKKGASLSVAPYVADNTLMLPLKDVTEQGYGKYYTYNDTANSGGFAVMGDAEFKMPIGSELQNLNDFLHFERPSMDKIKADYEASPLKGVHPRIMVDKSDFDRVRALCETDENMIAWKRALLKTADGYVNNPQPLIYELRDGVRLWYVSMDMVDIMEILGLAYQLTGDQKYVDRAWLDLESVCSFPSWHPEHHIDVGGLAVGVAIGYDWCYEALTPEQRAHIEAGAYNCGFFDYVDGYQGKSSLMYSGGIGGGANHNMVMNAGGAMLGLAFMDVYPEESAYCISGAMRCLEFAIFGYAPEGAWWEGMGYSAMTLEYMSYQLSSVNKVMQTIYQIDKLEGFDKIGQFFLHMQSKMGSFAYADGGSQSITFDPGVLWVSDFIGDYATPATYINLFGLGLDPRTMIWYQPDKYKGNLSLGLDHQYVDQPIVVMRDSWDKDLQNTFAGIKAGCPGDNHGHMDVGKFEFYANGVRWTRDIGSDNYNLPNYFSDLTPESPRWTYYRNKAESHSTIIIDPDPFGEYDPNVQAQITRFESKPRGTIAVVDMTESHMGKATKAERGLFFADDRRSLVIRDELTLPKTSKVYWHMVSDQVVDQSTDGRTVKIKQKGNDNNYVTVELISNKPFKLSVAPCEPLPSSNPPAGIANDKDKTTIRLEMDASGDVTITAKITPCTVENGKPITEFDKPIANWQIPDGEIPKMPVLDSLKVGPVEYDVGTKIVKHIVGADDTQIPEITATSSEFDVAVTNAVSFDGCSEVVVTSKVDPTLKVTYRVYFNKLEPLTIPGLTERQILKLTASAEPQPENPIFAAYDKNPDTRWSAEGNQYMILDLGYINTFDRVVMSFMNGNQRHYKLAMHVSNDGVEYTQVYSGQSDGVTEGYEIFNIGLQNARYVKIEGFGHESSIGATGSAWNSWTEVAVAKAD